MCAVVEGREVLDALQCLSALKTGSLIEHGARLAASKSGQYSYSAGVTGTSITKLSFLNVCWDLNLGPDAFTASSYPLSHLSTPPPHYFCIGITHHRNVY